MKKLTRERQLIAIMKMATVRAVSFYRLHTGTLSFSIDFQ